MSSRHIKEANESKSDDALHKDNTGCEGMTDAFQVSASGAGETVIPHKRYDPQEKGRHLAGCRSRNR